MKPKSTLRSFLLAAGSSLLAITSSHSADGTWDTDSAGNWTDITKWLGDTAFASGADFTATFGNFITADRIITLDTPITIGNITASDTTHNYTISGANILTLDRTDATKPTINVTTSGRTLTISSIIAGNDGLLKSGAGTLVFTSTSNNTFTGGFDISAGTVQFSSTTHANAWGDASNVITFTGNATLYNADGAYTLNRGIAVNNSVTGTIRGAFGETTTIAGAVTGSGSLTIVGDSNGFVSTLSNTANTFTGAISISANVTTTLNVASLGSSANAITLGGGSNNPVFNYTGTAALSRTFEIATTTGGVNINSTGSGALTASGFSVTGAGAKTITIGGASTASNTIAGNIVNNGGNTSLTKADGGTWILSGTNSYSGATSVTGGTLIVSGTGSTNSAAYTLSNAAILRGTTANAFGDTTNINLGGTSTLQLRGDSNATFGKTTGGAAYTTSITATGTTINVDRATVAGTNQTFTLGAHTITSTAATVSTTYSGANNTSLILGAVTDTTAVGGTVQFTNSITGGGSLTLASFAGTRTGTPTLQFSGTGNTTVTGAISQTGTQGLTKDGTGTLTLNGTNSYSGTTAISAGKLLLGSTGSLNAGSAVAVSGGALAGTGTVNGTTTVSSTGGIDLRDSAIGTLTLGSTLDINGAAGANNLRFDMGNGTGTSDLLSVGGTTSVTTSGAAVIALNWLGGASGRTATTYTLIGGAGTLDATNFAKFTLPVTAAFGQTYTLVHDLVSDGGTGNLQLTVANVTAATPAAFWAGTTNSWNTASNWKDALAGSVLTLVPDYQTNVTFAATGAGNLSNQLDADFDINSLNFNVGGVTIASTAAKTLTLEATNANGNTLGRGITSSQTTGTNTISSKIGLASDQTWSIAGSTAALGGLTVSGVISDFGLGRSLTKAGAGTLTLSTNPTYTGATIINGGTLDVSGQAGNPLSSSSGLTFTGTSNFTYASANINLPSTTINPGVTANFRNVPNGGIFTFTIPSLSGSGTFSGDNPGGSGQNKIIAFSDLSNFTGVLQMSTSGSSFIYQLSNLNDTVASNIRFAGNAQTLANPDRLRYVGSAGLTLTNRAIELAKGANSFVAIDNNGTNNSSLIINSNLAVTTAGAKTLTLGGTNTGGTSTFAGTINDGTSAVTSLNKADANTWSLTNTSNGFTGAISVNAGTLAYASAGGANGITFSNTTGGATLTYTGATSKTMSGAINASTVTSGTITLGSTGAGAVNYSNTASLGSAGSGNKNLILTGTNAGNNILAGQWVNNTGGAATLAKQGAGTWTLSGNNSYSGLTTIGNQTGDAGILNITHSSALGTGAVSMVSNTVTGLATLTLNSASGITVANNFSTSGTGQGNNGIIRNVTGNNIISGTITLTGGGGSTRIHSDGGSLTLSNTIAPNTTGRFLILGGSATGVVSGAINDGAGANILSGVTKEGSGTWTLSNTNTYTGSTAVNAGTLAINGTGTINNSSAINVAADSTLRYNSSTALIVAPTLAGNGTSNRAVLGGTGPIGVAVTLDNLGDVLSPGNNNPGSQNYTVGQIWSSFSYDWEVNNFTGTTAGTDFDQITGTDFTLGGGSGSYILNVLGLDAGNIAGLTPNFSELNRTWTILTSTGTSSFNAANWTINTSGFSSPDAGTWTLGQSGNDLVLTYTAIPEPSTLLLSGLGIILLLRRRR